MANLDQERVSVFAHKGWNRLVRVLCVVCLILSVAWFAYFAMQERAQINFFDQFGYVGDVHTPRYHFWVWLPEVTSAKEHHLVLRLGRLAFVALFPPVALAVFIYSAIWVRLGFRAMEDAGLEFRATKGSGSDGDSN